MIIPRTTVVMSIAMWKITQLDSSVLNLMIFSCSAGSFRSIPSAPNASQPEKLLWDSTLLVAASIWARSSGSEISRSSVIVQIARPSSRNAL